MRVMLTEAIDTAEWSWMETLARQGKVVMVSPNLELVEVGLAMAEDDAVIVQRWIDDGWLYQPTAMQLSRWNQHPEQRFQSLIVQPFVLAKELLEEHHE